MSASEKVSPGQPLNRSAKTWNRIIDHVDEAERLPRNREFPGNGVDVQIRNDTGSDQPLGSAVAIDADGYILAWAEEHYYSFWFAGVMPAADSHTFAILLAAIKSGEIGPARVAGRAMVRLHLTEVSHRWAKLTPGATYLSSAEALSGEGVKVIALQPSLGVPDQVVPAILQPRQQRCLPPFLTRGLRISGGQFIEDRWYTDQDCEQYTPYVLANLTDCYVPYSPYAPSGMLSYFANGFVLGDHPEWSVPEPWEILPPGVSDDTALHFPGDEEPAPAELTITIGEAGGFIQFRFTTSGSVGANVHIDGLEVVPSQSTGPLEWIIKGPYALSAGPHVISFGVTGTTGTCSYDDITVWGAD